MSSDIINFTKEEAIEFLLNVINQRTLYKGIEGIESQLESAIRVLIAHSKTASHNDLGDAVDALFQMYKRTDNIDKSYRNAARFILSVVDGVPARYESYDEDAKLPSELADHIKLDSAISTK